jgi:hypothetical protein
MYRESSTEADQRIRAALAASAERVRLIAIRDALQPDLDEAETYATRLESVLADEQRDVRRYERGVWAFIYDIFADREARLTKEQQEAHAAEAKYREAVALRDRLREEVLSVDARITAHRNAEADLAAARAAKHAAVLAGGGPAAQELDGIMQQLGTVDAESRAIDEALRAGERAQHSLQQLAEVLSSARNWGAADMFTDSFFISWAKRNKLDEARALAGTAQGELTVFRRELADVGVGLAAEIAGLADHHRFLDTWFDNIFSDFSVQGRIKEAQATTGTALEHVAVAVGGLVARRTRLDAARAQLTRQQLDLIERA